MSQNEQSGRVIGNEGKTAALDIHVLVRRARIPLPRPNLHRGRYKAREEEETQSACDRSISIPTIGVNFLISFSVIHDP